MSALLSRLLLLAGAACVVTATAAAAALNDPTRPPESLRKGERAAQASAPSAPQLQSILIARHPGGRHVAVIDGMTLRLGERYKGALLERMTDTEVVLVQGKTRQVLKLYPKPPGNVTP